MFGKNLAIKDENLPAITPMEILEMAVKQDAPLEKLEKLMDLNERWEKNEAKKAFVKALGAFKANPPELFKNKHVEYTTNKGTTSYHHATLDQVSNVIGSALAEHGLAHRWEVEQAEDLQIKVTCVLTHELGHSESVSLRAMPDDSGGKNSVQAIGSTTSYLERYTLLAVTGMATQDQDNDGAGFNETITEEQVEELTALADRAGADPEGVSYTIKVCRYFRVEALTELFPDNFEIAKSMLESKIPKPDAAA